MYDPCVVHALLELHAAEAPRVTEAPRPAPAPVLVPSAPSPSAPSRDALEVVADLAVAMPTHQSPMRVGEAVWNGLRDQLPATAFVLFTCEAQTLVAAYRTGDARVGPHTRIAVGERLSGWVAATRRSIVNSDAQLDFDDDVRTATSLCTALAVPVHRNGETLGVLAFYADRQDAFAESHQRLVEAAAYVAASALYQPAAPRVAVAV
jgi:GAF domain-containing protein